MQSGGQGEAIVSTRGAALLAAGAIIAAALWWRWGSALDHDVAYFVALAKILAGGRTLYADVLDQNTPAAVSLTLISVAASSATGIPADRSHLLTLLVLLSGALLVSIALFRRLVRDDPALVVGFAIAGATALFVAPASDFGRRGHLFAAFFLPFVLAVLSDLRGVPRPAFLSAAVVSFATFGLFLKPHFALFAVALGLYELQQKRFRLGETSRETIGVAGASIATYVVFLIVAPAFLETVVPYVLASYRHYQLGFVPALIMTRASNVFVLGVLVMGSLLVRLRPGGARVRGLLPLAWMLWVAGVVSTGVQGFGFSYHALSLRLWALLAGTLLCFWAAKQLAVQLRTQGVTPLVGFASTLALTCALVLHLALYLTSQGKYERRSIPRQDLVEHPFVELFNANGRDEYVYLFCSSVLPGGWAHTYANTRWAGHLIPAFFFPILDDYRRQPALYPDADGSKLDEIEADLRQRVLRDFREREPHLVLFDISADKRFFELPGFDYLEFLMEDPEFAEHWHRYGYRELETVSDFQGRPFAVFERGIPRRSRGMAP
jgi:hypothetical protein